MNFTSIQVSITLHCKEKNCVTFSEQVNMAFRFELISDQDSYVRVNTQRYSRCELGLPKTTNLIFGYANETGFDVSGH